MSKFRAPDVTGPRYRPKYLVLLKKELYKEFLEKYPEYKGLSYEEFRTIIKSFNRSVCETIPEEREGVELPQRLGYLYVGSCEQPTKENVDYAKSKQYGKKILHRNLHTDGRMAKLFYENSFSKYDFKHRSLWSF